MSEEFPELPSASGWSDLPVFRDLGDLIGPSSGPVNWDVARQVAVWVATSGEEEVKPDPAAAAQISELVRIAELRVIDYTGMSAGTQIGQIGVVNRTGWIESAIPGFRYVLDKLAERMTATMRSGDDQPNPLAAMIEPMMPAVFGAQLGILIGYMSTKVLGQFDILLPRTDGSRVYMVLPNIDSITSDYELKRDEFMLWVAAHELAHQVEFAVPWVRRYFTRLVETAISEINIDPDTISERFDGIDLANIESLEKLFGDPTGLLGLMFSPADTERLGLLHAFMTVVEGYAEHVMDASVAEVVPSIGQMREVLARHRADRSAGEKLIERLLGLDMKRAQYREGEEFCGTVVSNAGLETLNRLWESEDNLPSIDEIRMPQMWQLRVEPGE